MCSPTGKDPEVLTARKYFASASFHDTGGRSASTLTLALVFIELNPKTFLRVVNLLQGGHGNRELAITKSADSDCTFCDGQFTVPMAALKKVHDAQESLGLDSMNTSASVRVLADRPPVS